MSRELLFSERSVGLKDMIGLRVVVLCSFQLVVAAVVIRRKIGVSLVIDATVSRHHVVVADLPFPHAVAGKTDSNKNATNNYSKPVL